ncbi:hypothetical protein A6A06_20365 [Streptomyces sp. CB02923]|uniref:DUF4097 family beta strand repeat-containing protein n=1 Tax=Streptomyces sp. CB02923 TaxID=1718985 RepID=UPI00093C01DA|nr:DUF4097 family beta strand repeat-containing protein [Streptomyces sp. CB02923]OKI01182.1 hypothetical protein A6A06_20365 [Streptomyces sp. CB02923]
MTTSEESKSEKRDFAYSGTKLSIRAANSSVRLKAGDSDGTVRVQRTLKGKAGDADNSEWSLEGSTLTLRTDCHGISLSCEAAYTVSVPKGAAVEVTSTAGPVSAAGLAQPLELNVKDASAEVEKISGKLGMTVSGGNATATDITSGQFSATTANGRVKATFAAAPRAVTASAGNGNVNVTLPKGGETYRVTTKATNGRAHSSVPDTKGSDRSLELKSQNGSVRVDRAE